MNHFYIINIIYHYHFNNIIFYKNKILKQINIKILKLAQKKIILRNISSFIPEYNGMTFLLIMH